MIGEKNSNRLKKPKSALFGNPDYYKNILKYTLIWLRATKCGSQATLGWPNQMSASFDDNETFFLVEKIKCQLRLTTTRPFFEWI